MQLLYVDESIDTTTVSIGGIYLPDLKYRKATQDIDAFLTRELKFNVDWELHADTIWNGRTPYNTLTMFDRANITIKIAEFLSHTKITKFLSVSSFINDEKPSEIYLRQLQKIVDYAANQTSHVGKTNKQLLLIFDQRSDIHGEIHDSLLIKRSQIIKQHSTSCAFIDAGYEGDSRYSRLLQVADFVAYWTRQYKVKQEQPSLFKHADDQRKIDLVDKIIGLWQGKLKTLTI